MTHAITKQPAQCPSCAKLPTDEYDSDLGSQAAVAHRWAQDAAMCRAWRKAAGSENPVTWLVRRPPLQEFGSALADETRFRQIADALRAEIKSGAPADACTEVVATRLSSGPDGYERCGQPEAAHWCPCSAAYGQSVRCSRCHHTSHPIRDCIPLDHEFQKEARP